MITGKRVWDWVLRCIKRGPICTFAQIRLAECSFELTVPDQILVGRLFLLRIKFADRPWQLLKAPEKE